MDIFSRVARALQHVLNSKADELAKKTVLSSDNVKLPDRTL
jgi:hypothetical protein